MKRNSFFMIVVMFVLICTTDSFAQKKQQTKKTFTLEQRIEHQVRKMQNQLMLDDKTNAQFAVVYKEYLYELKNCYSTMQKPDGKQWTDEQIKQNIKNRFTIQQKVVDTKEKYFAEFQKFLNARQLEKVFKPQKRNMAKVAQYNQRQKTYKKNRVA